MNYKELGFAIYRRRREKDLSQQDLATLAGISRNYVSIIERGDVNNISIEVLEKLAKVFGVEVSYLVQILEQDEKGKI